MVGSLLYSLVRVLLDVIAASHGDQAKLQAEVLALRRQVQVLERQDQTRAVESGRSDEPTTPGILAGTGLRALTLPGPCFAHEFDIILEPDTSFSLIPLPGPKVPTVLEIHKGF